MSALGAAMYLAWREQRSNLRASLCYALALASMLAPLLTLLALKNGVVDRMTEQLLRAPSTLEILPVGAGRYDAAFFQSLDAMPETGFVSPRTRSISSRLMALSTPDRRTLLRGPAMIPTGADDPVTRAPAPSFAKGEVVLSAEAARQLGVGVGSELVATSERERDGQVEHVEMRLLVSAIAPAENYGRVAVFAPLPLLVAVENFLDGAGEPGPDWIDAALSAPRKTFASFRLYAASIFDVLHLRDAMEARGVSVRARGDEIETVLQLDRALDWLFVVIASVAGGGFWLSLAASLRSNVERLRETLSMFRLLGASRTTRFLFPMAQSALIVLAGAGMALLAYAVIAWLVDSRADGLTGGGSVMSLGPAAMLEVAGVLTVGGALAAAFASREAVSVRADEVVRRT